MRTKKMTKMNKTRVFVLHWRFVPVSSNYGFKSQKKTSLQLQGK